MPTVSSATAESVYAPSGVEVPIVVFHVVTYGDERTAAPMFAPFSLNWTKETPTVSVAVAVSATDEPPTVAPLAGAVSKTVGGVVSC